MRCGVAFVEDADRRPLAALGRQGGDTQVDAAVLDRDADAAVLGDPLLGDVELAHDLQARDHRADHPLRDVRGLLQHAVDPEADPHLALFGLEVDVGGALGHGLGEDAVDELDHRRVLGARLHVADLGERFVLFLLVLPRSMIASATVLCSVPSRASSASTSLFGGDGDVAVEAGGDLDVVDGEHVGRVGGRDQQRVLVDVADRHRLVAARHRHREQGRRGDVDAVDGEVDVVEAVALGGRPRELVLVDRALLEQQRLRRAARRAGALDRRLATSSGEA